MSAQKRINSEKESLSSVTKTLISSLPRHHNISMKLLVLVSSCLVVSNALPLIDYIYKGYEQAPYTVTADYNVVTDVLMKRNSIHDVTFQGIETRKYPEAWWACTEGSVAVTGEERVGLCATVLAVP